MGTRRIFALLARVGLMGAVAGALVAAGLTPAGAATPGTASPATTSSYHLVFTPSPHTAVAGQAFGTQPVVSVENATGTVFKTATGTVSLSITSTPVAGASLKGCTGGTLATGVATFSTCEIDKSGTGFTLAASVTLSGTTTPIATTSAPFDVSAGAPAKLVFATQPATITAGVAFAPAPVLTVEDAEGNPVTTATFHLQITAVEKPNSTQGGPLVCSGEGLTGDVGVHYGLAAPGGSATFTTCTIDTPSAPASSYELLGLASNSSGLLRLPTPTKKPLSVESASFDVNAGPPAKLAFTTNPNAAVLGEPLGVQPVVAVEDAAGNVITTATGTVSLSVTATKASTGASLEGCSTGTLTTGVTTFSGCELDKAGAGFELTAAVTLAVSDTTKTITGKSASFTVSAGPAASLAFTRQPGKGAGGSPLATQPVVTVRDATGQLVSGTVELTLEASTGGAAPAGAALTCGANPAPAGTGVASFAGCAVNEVGTYRLVATDPDAPAATTAVSTSFTVTTGAPAQVVFAANTPSSSTGGVPFSTQPTVSVEDLGGNPIPGSKVVLAIAQGTGTPGAALTCTDKTDTATATTGTVTFTGCAIDTVGTGYELTATSGSVVGTSAPFTVTLGPPSKLEFTEEPSGGTVSTPFGGQPQVTVTDAGGNPEVATAAAGVTITLTTTLGQRLSCLANPVPTDATGVAVFAGCKTARTGTLTLGASGDGFSATSASFTVVTGRPLGVTSVEVPDAQTFGGDTLGADPTSIVDDVDSATGALDVGYTDLQVAAVGEPFTLTRTYNSDDTTGGSFGPGWTSILDAGVTVAATGRTATVRGPEGQQLVFTGDGRGGWTAPPGARSSLSCQGTLCTVTQFDGTVFQSVDGQIRDELSADGVGLHFVYSHGRLTRITGSAQTLLEAVQSSLGAELGEQGWTAAHAGSTDLNAVAALGQRQVWAVGDGCTIESSDDGGTSWAKDTDVSGCAAGTDLTGVAADGSGGPVFAVGTRGTVLVCASRCDGASARWSAPGPSTPAPPANVNFSSVFSPDPGVVYAAGTTTTGAGEIWACSDDCVPGVPGPPHLPPGAGWVDVTPSGLSSTALTSVSGDSSGLVVAAGAGGTILVCSAATCAKSSAGWAALAAGEGGTAAPSTVTFSGVQVTGPDQVEAVGTTTGGDGEIWACGDGCSARTAGPPSQSSGRFSQPKTASWAEVTPQGLGAAALTSVAGSGAGAVWATAADGQIWYCPASCATEPTDWVSLGAPGGPAALAGVTSAGPGHAWAVGAGGTVDATTAPSATLGALSQAIVSLGAALTGTAWLDGNDLSEKQGRQVLARVQQAVQDLWQLAAPPPSEPGHHFPPVPPARPSIGTAPAWDAAALLDLTQALRIVDASALSENLAVPERPDALDAAQTQFAAGDAEAGSGQYLAAAVDYGEAWAQAQAAAGSGQGSDAPLEVEVGENATGEVTSLASPTRTVRYGYTGGLLTSFTDADGETWTYGYTTPGSAPLLAKVTAPTGTTRLAVSYSSSGRVDGASELGSQTHFVDAYTWTPSTQTSTRASLVQLAEGAPKTCADFLDEYTGNVLLAQQLPDGATTSYGYDADLDLTGLQSPLGHVQRMTYDSAGNLLTQSNPAYGGTAVTSFTYDQDHQVLSKTDADGNTTTYAYRGGNLVEVTPPGPSSDATRYRFDALGEEVEAIGPTATETFSYDAAGDQTGYQLLSPAGVPLDGRGPVMSYDEAGQVLVSTDPRGHTATGLDPAYQTVSTYDADGELLSSTTPGTATTTTTYTPAGDVASVTGPTKAVTTYTWDETKLQLASTGPAGRTVSTYDPSGQLLAQTSASGAKTTYTYDASGLETSKTGPTLITTSYQYDIEGDVVASTTSAGDSSTFAYDPAGQIVTSTENGMTSTATYDLDGNVLSETDPDGRTTTDTYNSQGLLSSVTTGAGTASASTTSYAYDPTGNLVAVTDGDGHAVTYTVNGAGERTGMTVDGNASTYGYDVAGNLVSETDPDTRTTTYALNAEDERTGIAYTQPGRASIDIAQTFDAAGQRTSVTNPTTGSTTTYSYDAGGDLTSAATSGTGPAAGTYGYTYAAPGKMVETYPDGSKISYSYDDADSLMGVSATTGTATAAGASYIRNADRLVTGIAYSNGILETQGYDGAHLLTSMALTCGTTTELTRATSFDDAGDPLAAATTVGATTTTERYGYSANGRVDAQSTTTTAAATKLTDKGCTSGVPSSTPGGNDGSGAITPKMGSTPTTADQPVVPTEGSAGAGTTANPVGYDAVGNITSMSTGTTTTTITYNPADEVASESGKDAAAYTYDKNGDVTSETVGGATTTYSYNAADQLVEVTKTHGSTQVAYTYDGNGNRVSRTVTSGGTTTVTDYSWDPDTKLPLLTLVCTGSCATRADVVDRFVYGVGPVAMETRTGTYYLHEDQQGDVVAVSDAEGAVVETFTYGAFGQVTATPVGTATVPDEPLEFQSQFLTTVTGLYDLRAREYDPDTGTFLQRDPVTPAVGTPVVSPYAYAGDQATVSADPTGDTSASDVVDSWFYGHSTTTTDIVAATQATFLVPKLALKAANLISTYGEQTVADAMDDVEAASSAIGDLGPDFAESASAVTEDLGGLSDAASIADGAGLALSVIGIGLSAYVTVEDCEHGTVSQCVGDAVGTAIGAVCAGAGIAAAVVGTAGAAVPVALALCGVLAAALSIVISRFGAQIVEGLAPLGQYAAEGYTEAIGALQTGFEEAGSVLKGAYATAAGALANALSAAEGTLSGVYGAARGVVTDGFNTLDGYISSGVSSAISTLEDAGLTALGLAYVLKDQLGQDLHTVAGELISFGYDVDGIAAALRTAFEDPAQTAAVFLHDLGFTYDEIASGLTHAYHELDTDVTEILAGIGATADEIAGALATVYDDAVTVVAHILKIGGYTVVEVLGALKTAFKDLEAGTLAGALKDAGYAAEDIAEGLAAVFEYGAQEVGLLLNDIGITTTQIADTLRTFFEQTATEVADFFKSTLGAAASTVATVLVNAFQESAEAVAEIFHTVLHLTITTIKDVLTQVFGLTVTQIISTLKHWFTTTLIAGLGGAYGKVKQFFTTTVKNFFTTTIGSLF